MSVDYLTQLDRLLDSPRQAWLLGAGVSIGAKIPLMYALTERVFAILAGQPAEVLLEALKEELPATAHIEHFLSQIGDYAAIADRSKRDAIIAGKTFLLSTLEENHNSILRAIAETIRWGYKSATATEPEEIGDYKKPLVRIEDHVEFIRAAIGKLQAGIGDRREPIRLFTTNYDTLIEDALSLESYSFWDGFSGGSVAFRNYRYGDSEPSDHVRAHVIKLHGSIDWHLGKDGKVWRVRDMDLYPERTGRVLIYPQSTKYLATQRDPFAAQFDLFRRQLSRRAENILAICGYSFGDDHINQEMELALLHPDNKTTVLAFTSDLNDLLNRWRSASWGKRLYIISSDGLYVGSEGPFFSPAPATKHEWWKFGGVIKLLKDGAEASVI